MNKRKTSIINHWESKLNVEFRHYVKSLFYQREQKKGCFQNIIHNSHVS